MTLGNPFWGSKRHGLLQRSPASRACHLLWAMLALSVGIAAAQIDSSQFIDRNVPKQPLVSLNQLLTPRKAMKATERAREELLHGRFESAEKEAQRALDIFPRCALAFNIQGAVYLQRANYPEAARAFQEAIDSDPRFGAAYLGLGMVYTTQGRFKEALIPLDRAVAFLPSSWPVYMEAAFAHLGVGEPEAAIKEITYAERFAGDDPRKRAGVSYLDGVAQMQLQEYDNAKRYLSDVLVRDPKGIYAKLAKKRLDQIDSLSRNTNQQIAHSPKRGPF